MKRSSLNSKGSSEISTSSQPDRYPGLARHWTKLHGEKVWRISLDPGFSCPNRDGALGEDGCAYCNPSSFAPSAGDKRSITLQLDEGINRLRKKGFKKFAAYFQPHTNTYAPVEELRKAWDEVLPFKDVVALCIGTRPDCLDEQTLDALADYKYRHEIWLEIGLQSANDSTLKWLNRRHSAGDFAAACQRAKQRGIKVCAHVILGLPGETARSELETARFLSAHEVEGIKLHHLSIIKGTRLERDWRAGEIGLLSQEEYAARASAFILQLAPTTIIHRLVGQTMGDGLLAPVYDKRQAVAMIRNKLDEIRK